MVPKVVWRVVLLMRFTECWSREMLHGKSVRGQIKLGYGTRHVEVHGGCLHSERSSRKESYLPWFYFPNIFHHRTFPPPLKKNLLYSENWHSVGERG